MKGVLRPHAGFKKDRAGPISVERIRSYWSYDGDDCEYIASQMMHPWHADLLWSRLRYFFCWRRSLYEGVCLDTDIGYIWLHVMELLTVDDDPLENHECLLRMREWYGGQDETVDGILDQACFYFEVTHGLDITDAESLDKVYRIVRICRKLSSSRLDPLSPGDLFFITGYRGRSIDRYAGASAPIVSAVLHEIGRAYAGKGILELCSRPVDIQISMPFKEEMSGSLVAPLNLKCRDPKRSEPFADLVKSLHKTCIMRLAGKNETLRGNQAKYQRILEGCIEAWRNGTLGEMSKPYRKIVSPLAVVNRLAVPYEECVLPHRRDGTWPSYRFRTRMREYGDIRMPAVRPTMTKNPRPCYSRMTLDEYASYQSWKESVLKGEETEVCEGFVWLLVNEVMHDDSLDPGSVLEVLRVCRTASDGHLRTKVELVMADWCIYHDLDADVSELFCDSVRIGTILARSLSSDPPRRLSQGLVERLCQSEGGKADVDLVNASISALYRYHGNTLAELFNAGRSRTNVAVFEDCACMPKGIVMKPYSDMEGVTRFLKSVSTIVYSVQNGDENPRCPFSFGSRNRDIVRDAARAAIETKKALRIKSMSEDVKLDMDAVNSATEDLDAVTGMMYSGEEEESERTEPEQVEDRPSCDDPWEDFASRLSPDLLEYISGCLEGRRPDRKSEKAVNEIAMDTIGDVVVEDGQAIEDYSEHLEKISKNYLGHQ